MAGLRQMRGKWYARVRYMKGVYQKEQIIPLKTSSKVEARERQLIVNRFEKDIKKGIEYSFPWLNDDHSLTVQRYGLELAKEDYLKSRSAQILRPKTIEQNELALRHFVSVVGKSIPVEIIDTRHFDNFKAYFRDKHSITTINMNLRALKTFFFWLKDTNCINAVPKIRLLTVDKSFPIYITDSEFDQILSLGWLSDFHRRVFSFYRDTGCYVLSLCIQRLILLGRYI
jgi:hypothetical protein